MKKIIRTVAILSLAGVFAACGNTQAEIVEDSEKSAEVEVKTVNVAVEAGAKPISFEDENGELTGYEVELLQEIDELVEEYDFNLEAVDGDSVQIGLDAGKYALIGGGLYKTPEREEKYLFPDEINGVSLVNIYVREDDTSIASLDDLVGKNVVPSSPNGGIYNLLTAYNEEHPDARITINTAEGVSIADRFLSVDSGEYDAIVIPNNLGFDEIKETLNLKVKAVEEPVKVNPTYFVLGKDQTDLREKLDEALVELKEEGKLSELSIKWYGEDTFTYYEE
jgi:ABC-type amino acid transport substrate-binding protein